MQRQLSPHACIWDGPNARHTPESDDLPWCRRPERLLTIEDVKYVLSLHYQGTPYDCYGKGPSELRASYRPIGVNRNDQLAILQLRPYAPVGCRGVQWQAFGSNAFNGLVALYAGVRRLPAYLCNTGAHASSESFYWANRLVAALADAHYAACTVHVERYAEKVSSLGHAMLACTDRAAANVSGNDLLDLLEGANQQMAADLRRETEDLLDKVLYTSSLGMRNAFARSDG